MPEKRSKPVGRERKRVHHAALPFEGADQLPRGRVPKL